MRRINTLLLVLLPLSLAIGACNIKNTKPTILGSEKIYTAQNIWFTNPKEIWAINYKRGNVIPAGTRVYNFRLGTQKYATGGIRFEDSNGTLYQIRIKRKWHPEFTFRDYADILFTSKSFEELTDGLTASEIDAIKRGVLVKGMSKRAVLISYGKPAEHQTPFLSSSSWLYHTTVLGTKRICFDRDNLTVKCSEDLDTL